jgi:hypothetical protein
MTPATSDRGWLNFPPQKDTAQLALAASVIVAWAALYTFLPAKQLCDEITHLVGIIHLSENRAGWPTDIAMMPSYHLVVASLTGLLPADITARLTSAFAALLLITVGYQLTRRMLKSSALQPQILSGDPVLLLALLPLVLPYTSMIYTDVLSLALVTSLVWSSHTRAYPFLGPLCLLLATAVRQTNAIWGIWLIAHEWMRARDMKISLGQLFFRHLGVFMLFGGVLLGVLVTKKTTFNPSPGAMSFNFAMVHSAGQLLTLLTLPFITESARKIWEWWKPSPHRMLWLCASLIALVASALCFHNPHIWNQEIWLAGTDYALLRNWPLVSMQQHTWLIWASSANLVFQAAWLTVAIRQHTNRWPLLFCILAGLATAGINGLVEPRYFIPAITVAIFYLQLSREHFNRLAIWWAKLSLLLLPWVLTGIALW